MKEVYRYDINGYYLEPIIIIPNSKGKYELPENCTEEQLPQPNWKPRFDGKKWVETITEEELGEISTPNVEKNEIEILQEKNNELEGALLELTTISATQELYNSDFDVALIEISKISAYQEQRNIELESALLEMTEFSAQQQAKIDENEQAILALKQSGGAS